jgi:hypothetical protein
VHAVLALPATGHHRHLVKAHRSTFAAAFPVTSDALERALADPSAAWPGDGLFWIPAHAQGRPVTSSPGRRPPRAPGR